MKYADVIIDNNTNATDELYTYACDFDDVQIGQLVHVPFSIHNRLTDGYVVGVHENAPKDGIKYKKVIDIDENTILSKEAVNTALWIRTRYICRYIEAIKLFLAGSDAKRKTKDPFENLEISSSSDKKLNDEQKVALEKIGGAIEKASYEAFLLHGVTGSGKTEIYIQAAKRAIELGKSAIILVPEIALTPQTVSRFVSRFGRDAVAVLHSRLTPAQKAVEYKKIKSGSVKLVIGARSAIFAPFDNIGLIVIDEEHETSYKSDMSPKYDAIEVALKRAMQNNAVLVLGSATPSVADYSRAESGIYTLIELANRYNNNPLPKAEVVDMSEEVRNGNRNLFSDKLADAVKETLAEHKQVILFLNRRGYSSYISCRECGFTLKCPDCGISMAYHKDQDACVCHYCGKKLPLPKVCPECGSKLIGRYGVGTQQVEEMAVKLFPGANVERLDFDSVKHKGELEAVLGRFGKGKTDILIGTQLVAKGLDYANVGLVGVISADVTLNIPDFRSSERTFQLITQAAGRSGRGDVQGRVIIQTYQPESHAVTCAMKHDYKAFYEREIEIRKALAYPPYGDIFRIVVSDENEKKTELSAKLCAEFLAKRLDDGFYILGPSKNVLAKQNGMYRYQILIKSPQGKRAELSNTIRELKKSFDDGKNLAKLLTTDINPYSLI